MNRRGMTGLDLAIILVAFVVVAAAFSFVVLNTNFKTLEPRPGTSNLTATDDLWLPPEDYIIFRPDVDHVHIRVGNAIATLRDVNGVLTLEKLSEKTVDSSKTGAEITYSIIEVKGTLNLNSSLISNNYFRGTGIINIISDGAITFNIFRGNLTINVMFIDTGKQTYLTNNVSWKTINLKPLRTTKISDNTVSERLGNDP